MKILVIGLIAISKAQIQYTGKSKNRNFFHLSHSFLKNAPQTKFGRFFLLFLGFENFQ